MSPEGRITTVEIDEETDAYINQLIENGKIRSMKDFIMLAIDFARKYSIDNWSPGVFYIGPVRVGIIDKRSLETLASKANQRETGRSLGEMPRDMMMIRYNIDTTLKKNRTLALDRLADLGIGRCEIKDDKILVHRPIFPHDIMWGYIEAYLDVALQPVPMNIPDLFVFQIVATEEET
jgi:hypothetical protein